MRYWWSHFCTGTVPVRLGVLGLGRQSLPDRSKACIDIDMQAMTETLAATDLQTVTYPIYSATHGTEHWSCPVCGQANVDRLQYGTFRVQCSNERCATDYVLGRILWRPPRGGCAKLCPADVIYMRDRHVMGRMRDRRATVNRIGQLTDSTTTAPHNPDSK